MPNNTRLGIFRYLFIFWEEENYLADLIAITEENAFFTFKFQRKINENIQEYIYNMNKYIISEIKLDKTNLKMNFFFLSHLFLPEK